MQLLEVSGAVRPIYGSLGVKRLNILIDSVVFEYITFPALVESMCRYVVPRLKSCIVVDNRPMQTTPETSV